MLQGEDLWFRHHRSGPWILHGHSICVAPGRVVGLRGPSGSGKSTLAAVLGGLRRADRGQVTVSPDAPGTGPNPVQVVLQRPETAMDPRWRIGRILEEAGEGDDGDLVEARWLDRFPHEISGGELQRVNLARALRARPAYVVADEISSSLDAITQAMLWDRLLQQVDADGLGVLAISHDQALLDAVADEVVDLADLAAETTPALGPTADPARS